VFGGESGIEIEECGNAAPHEHRGHEDHECHADLRGHDGIAKPVMRTTGAGAPAGAERLVHGLA
jgi:hypothetical protein